MSVDGEVQSGLEGVVAFATTIAEPDKEGGSLRYRGVDIEDLVGQRFRVGEVECVGEELCEPCNHLQSLTKPGVLPGLVHRGGLRADIVQGGRIAVGDEIVRVSSAGHG